MFFDTSLVPHTATGSPNLRSFGPSPGDTGGGRYNFEMYITECGDPEIRTLAELVEKQNYWNDPVMPARNIASSNLTLATGSALQVRFALQTTLIPLRRGSPARAALRLRRARSEPARLRRPQ